MKISLPKKNSYSLEELPSFLSKTYNLDIVHDDLITYAREGKLKTCIRLEGNTKGVYAIGRIKMNEEDYLQIHTPPTTIFFNSTAKKFFLPHDLHLEDDNVYFGARLPMLDYFYQQVKDGNRDYNNIVSKIKTNINEFIESSKSLPEYEYQLLLRPKEFNYIFSADFYLPQAIYNTNTKLLKEHIIPINFSDDNFYLLENTNIKTILINLALKLSSAPTLAIHFKQIEVLHSDLMAFLGISDKSQENYSDILQEIERLKSELEEKDKKITELQTALDKMNYPIQLNKFMENDRLALAIQARKEYWANYDPNLNNAPKAEATAKEIQEKYNLSQKQATAIEIVACPINRN
ncbi:hypothetical protein [Aggregatibacter kilianii]|uniref:hypothetical protein n=1 Tax=Aggregatibacter kilianii TaxID=2025884 RepID=UPI000D64C1F0|nr:hypothetical protein [Aggregatibacter kilianii]RDE87991.1 hypothetical protein DPV90_02925 [Aggregatibacter aphrophilus]